MPKHNPSAGTHAALNSLTSWRRTEVEILRRDAPTPPHSPHRIVAVCPTPSLLERLKQFAPPGLRELPDHAVAAAADELCSGAAGAALLTCLNWRLADILGQAKRQHPGYCCCSCTVSGCKDVRAPPAICSVLRIGSSAVQTSTRQPPAASICRQRSPGSGLVTSTLREPSGLST